MKNGGLFVAMLATFCAIMATGIVLVAYSQPAPESQGNMFEQEKVFDKDMDEPSGYLTKEQREAVENGDFDKLNEV